jgi:pimeloyl-ACP methyl ester carboxylesterase
MASAQQQTENFSLDIEYLKYLPKDYQADGDKKWPLLVFLHGAGERGTDIEKIKVHGPPMLIEQGKDFPFIVVSPQAKKYGWEPMLLREMIRNLMETEAVDPDRVYLTGLSMGGYGTWRLAAENPGLFAAIVPICGGGNPEDVWKLRHMPTWVFHGAKDGIVPLSASESMVKPLQKINDQVKFTVYPETYHDSWIQAYNDPNLYEWLLQQKRFLFKPIALNEDTLMEYVGIYNMQMDDMEIRVACNLVGGKLQLMVNENKIPLQAYEPDRFFVDPKMQLEFHFHRDEQGKVTEASMFQNTVYTLKKVSE